MFDNPYEEPVVTKPAHVEKKFWAEGINLEKAQMAILAIGSEYYEQVSPAVSDPPSLKVSPVPPPPPLPSIDKEKSPPPPPPPERPVGKVLPVTTTISTSAILNRSGITTVSAFSITSAFATSTTTCRTASPVCSISSSRSNVSLVPTSPKPEASQIPFLSDDPNDKVFPVCTSPNISSRPSEQLVDPYRPSSPPPPPLDPYRPPPAPPLDLYRSPRPPLLPVPAVMQQGHSVSNTKMENSPTLPKRPIMEVSPVVRSSSGPWLHSYQNRGIPSFMSPNIPFRSIDQSMHKSRFPSSFTGEDAFSVNREEGENTYYFAFYCFIFHPSSVLSK